MKPYIISISGGSGSGKTYLANQLLEFYGKNNISLIQVDSYYKDLKHLPMEEREKNNFDHPDAFDFGLLYNDVKRLKKSQSINIPSYDYVTHTRNKKTCKINNNSIVIIEGIFSTYYDKLRDIIDFKVYINVNDKLRKTRRIIRDKESRGRTEKSIIKQYQNTVHPMYLKFVKPLMKYSDLIIKDNSNNSNGINILNDCINSILNK